MNTEQQLVRIQDKLQLLLQQYQHVLKENQQLQKDKEKLQQLVDEQQAQLQQLQHKYDAGQLQGNKLSPEAKLALEKRINTYLKDIDRCLALLNS